MRRYLLIASLLIVLGTACSRRPRGVLSDKATASLLADMNMADAYSTLQGVSPGAYRAGGEDSARKVLRQSILERHGVTESQFDSTLSWYGHNLDRYDEVCDMMIEQLERKQGLIAAGRPIWEGKGSDEQKGNGLWPGESVYRLDASGVAPQSVQFSIPKPKLEKGAHITWEFKTVNMSAPLEAYIAVEYTDGSTGYVTRTLTSDGRQSVALQTDSALRPRLLYGYLRPRQTAPLLLDSVNLQSSPFSPSTYYEIYSVRTYRP